MRLTQVNLIESSCVWAADALLGEGPVWDSALKVLWWTDIKGRQFHRYAPETGEKKTWDTARMIGSFALSPKKQFIAATDQGFAWLSATDGQAQVSFDPIIDPEGDILGNRFNDGKCDPLGRFWAGTMDNAEKSDTGSWWLLDENLECLQLDHGFGVTNGPAFDVGRNRVYFTDSKYQRIFMAELTDGGFSNRQLFRQFEKGFGYPDGMTVDKEGGLWIAFWGGYKICRLDPENGDVVQAVELPVPQPTSIIFGGAEGKTAFVTSAAIGLSEEEKQEAPLSGGLFSMEFDRPLMVPMQLFTSR